MASKTQEGIVFTATPHFVYFPVSCPWPSPESDTIKQEALKQYKALCLVRKPVYLICSSYWACEGFWIEFVEPKDIISGTIMARHE